MFLANWSQTNRHCCVNNIDARGYYAGGHLHEVSIRVSRRPLTRRIGLKMSAIARIFPQTQFEFFELERVRTRLRMMYLQPSPRLQSCHGRFLVIMQCYVNTTFHVLCWLISPPE